MSWCLGRIASVGLIGLIWTPAAVAQNAADSLKRLERCGGEKLQAHVSALRLGLVDRQWAHDQDQRRAALPPEYLKNLADIATACEKRTATIEAIGDDLDAKNDDCIQYGMGRLVPVQVETLKGPTVVMLWEVFYEWVSGVPDKSTEMRVPGVTTANLTLPPGIYLFRARKDGVASSDARVPIFGQDKITVQITVP